MSSTETGVSGKGSKTGYAGQIGADASGDYTQFMSLTLQVSGQTSGTINVYVQPKKPSSGAPVAWSFGDPSQSWNGFTISMNTQGNLPLTSLNISPNIAQFIVGSSGGGNNWTFTVSGYLAGEESLQEFSMYTNADPTVVVQAKAGNGGYQTIGNSPSSATEFDWVAANP